MTDDIQMGDVARLRKPHPCGSYEWEVVRIGADIGLKCKRCGRRVLLDRATFRKRLKSRVRAPEMAAEPHPGEEQVG